MESWVQWYEMAEPMAYGVLGLLPWEFGEFTPAEFEQKLKGFNWKMEKQHKMTASWLAVVVGTQVGKKGRKPRPHDFFHALLQDPQNPFYVNYVGLK